jgi:hypothetical protein
MFLSAFKQYFVLGYIDRLSADTVSFIYNHVELFPIVILITILYYYYYYYYYLYLFIFVYFCVLVLTL